MAEPLTPEERADLVDAWDADLPDDRLINESLAIARYEATVRALEAERDALKANGRGSCRQRTEIDRLTATIEKLEGDVENGDESLVAEHGRLLMAQAERDALRPQWNHQLDGYVPQEGDWVLVMSACDMNTLMWGSWDYEALTTSIDDGVPTVHGDGRPLGRLIAHYRPPGPPPVPDQPDDT